MSDGYVDTNVFVHANAEDAQSAECRRFLAGLADGTRRARLHPLVLHELSYALPKFIKQLTRQEVGKYLLTVLDWPGIVADKDLFADAIRRWQMSSGISFVDAFLAVEAMRNGLPVYTKNVRDLRGQGADVPDPLPGSDTP